MNLDLISSKENPFFKEIRLLQATGSKGQKARLANGQALLEGMDSRNYQEKREIERLEAELRDATAYSQKCYSDIQRLKEAISNRDLDIRGFKLRIE